MFKKIAIVADHNGEDSKKYVAEALEKNNIEWVMPTYDNGEANDYPDIVKLAYELYQTGEVDGLILICGTGVGMMIGANKCKGIRCVWANTPDVAAFGRIHEDCNALALGAGYADKQSGYRVNMPPKQMQKIVRAFVQTQFAEGRHVRRVEKLNNL